MMDGPNNRIFEVYTVNDVQVASEPTPETTQTFYFVIGAKEALAVINENREETAKKKNKPVKGKLRTPSEWVEYFSSTKSIPEKEKIYQSGIQCAISGKGFTQKAKAETVMNTIHNACVKLGIAPKPPLSIKSKEIILNQKPNT